MLPHVATMFTTAVNLLEAEGRLARLYVVKVTAALFVVFFAIVAAGFGLLAALVGLTWLLMNAIGDAAGLVISGLVVASIGAATAWLVYRRLLDSDPPHLRNAATKPGPIAENNHHESATGSNQRGARGDRVSQDTPPYGGAKAAAL